MISANRFYCDGYEVGTVRCERGFHTHYEGVAEFFHQISETINLPGRWTAQLLGRVIEPLPGECKNKILKGVAIRVGALTLFLILAPLGLITFLVSLALRSFDHGYRPAISMLESQAQGKELLELELTREKPLHVRTHNVGFVSTAVSSVGDLRHPVERAHEIVESVLNDPDQPDIIIFEETFHEDAAKVLAEGVSRAYPHVIHSVAPAITGFNSGFMVASKYPIDNVKFRKFSHMLGPEKLAPRGIITLTLKSPKGLIYVHGVHTQALIGQSRAEARLHQIEDLEKVVRDHQPSMAEICYGKDASQINRACFDLAVKGQDCGKSAVQGYGKGMHVVMGDFNTSRVTAWGEDNGDQAEQMVLDKMNEVFDDLYLNDHDELGERTKGKRKCEDTLPEPRGSWYHGPFANKGCLLSLKMWLDRFWNGYPEPKQVVPLEKVTWGTPDWYEHQTANTARFDYILVPKNSSLKGEVEIRRVPVKEGTESSPSDHLPVDGWIYTLRQ